MTAYAIFMQERSRNAAELQTYAKLLKPLLGKSGGTVLAAYGRRQDVLQFSHYGAARAFYDSPEYPAAVKHRFLGADFRSFIIEGVN
ncbi:DUF1330 domain-containing protein [Rhizobium beringeri]|uniref:DUF1330 domain-containing protein n=1 Tax=Rhizobium beringeri TaxID=3019934 RepID=UPI003B5A4A9C